MSRPVSYRWGDVDGAVSGFLPIERPHLVTFMIDNTEPGESLRLRLENGGLVIIRPKPRLSSAAMRAS